MIIRTLSNVIQARYAPIVAVLGCEMESITKVLAGRQVEIAENPEWELGLGSSIKTGIRSLPEDAAGALLMLADMPLVQATTLQCLKERFLAVDGKKIIFPIYGTRQGNPVLFPAWVFPDLLQLERGQGAKPLLRKYANQTVPVSIQSEEILLDCDTSEDYRRILALME